MSDDTPAGWKWELVRLPPLCAKCHREASVHDDNDPDRECDKYQPTVADGLLRAVQSARGNGPPTMAETAARLTAELTTVQAVLDACRTNKEMLRAELAAERATLSEQVVISERLQAEVRAERQRAEGLRDLLHWIRHAEQATQSVMYKRWADTLAAALEPKP